MNEAKDSNTHKEIYFLRKRGLFKKCRLEKSIKVQPKKWMDGCLLAFACLGVSNKM